MRFFHFHTDKWVLQYLWNQLSPSARKAFEKHLESCDSCRARLAKEKEFESLMVEAGKFIAPAMEGLNRIKEKIGELPPLSEGKSSPERKIPSLSWKQAWQGAAVAVVVAIALLSGWNLIPRLEPVKIDKVVGSYLKAKSLDNQSEHFLARGDRVYPHDVLLTKKGTRVKVKIGNLGYIWVRSDSSLTFNNKENSTFAMESGEIWVEIKKHGQPFLITTPMGTVKVLGTEYRVTLDASKLTVDCLKSRVMIENPLGNVVIPQGFTSETRKNEAPSTPIPSTPQPDWRKVVDYYGKMKQEDFHEFASSLCGKGQKAYIYKNFEESWKYYAQASYLMDYKSYSTLEGMGYNSWKLGLKDRACNEFLKAYCLNPLKDKETPIAKVFLESGYYELAWKTALNIYHSHADKKDPCFYLGETYLALHKYQEAERYIDMAFPPDYEHRDECYYRYHVDKAYLAAMRGDITQAYKQLSQLDPNIKPDSFTVSLLALTYQKLGNRSAENEAWSKYLEIYPTGPYSQLANQRLSQ
jgi:ferric-dicitrate binding protein FerR (iron transport regulator)